MTRIETDRIKKGVDIRELASRYVDFRQQGSEERSGPCPKCGGDDRFHCTADWFFCRKCHEKRDDAIGFMMWLEDCDFRNACKLLTTADAITVEKRTPIQRKKSQSHDWHKQADLGVARAVANLNGPIGERGRTYLLNRGLESETWQAWKLGFNPNVQRRYKQGEKWHSEDLGPAVTLPWYEGDRVTALQYRFLDPGKLRYWQKPGGDRILFGLPLLVGRPILVVCEGEFNAVSIWQAAQDMVDVVSFGSESNLAHSSTALSSLAQGYEHVIVWADKSERSLACREIVGTNAKALKSPRGLDANDLLKTGQLRSFVMAALVKFQMVKAPHSKTSEQSKKNTEAATELPHLSPRLTDLLAKPLLEHEVAELAMLADQHHVPLVWQRYDFNDPSAGWHNIQ